MMESHFAMRTKEYLVLNANTVAIDPLLTLYRATIRSGSPGRLNGEGFQAAKLSDLAKHSPPMEIQVKQYWKELIAPLPVSPKMQEAEDMLQEFMLGIAKTSMLDYIPTPPGQKENNSTFVC